MGQFLLAVYIKVETRRKEKSKTKEKFGNLELKKKFTCSVYQG